MPETMKKQKKKQSCTFKYTITFYSWLFIGVHMHVSVSVENWDINPDYFASFEAEEKPSLPDETV